MQSRGSCSLQKGPLIRGSKFLSRPYFSTYYPQIYIKMCDISDCKLCYRPVCMLDLNIDSSHVSFLPCSGLFSSPSFCHVLSSQVMCATVRSLTCTPATLVEHVILSCKDCEKMPKSIAL